MNETVSDETPAPGDTRATGQTPSTSTAGTVVVYRPRRAMWMSAALAVLLLGVFSTVAILLRSSEAGAIFHLSDQIAMFGVGILLAGGALLFGSPRARADDEGIEVRNVVFTKRIAWTEVVGVSFPDGASFARLELPDDEYHSVLAVQSVDRGHAVEAVRTLRRMHRAAQH